MINILTTVAEAQTHAAESGGAFDALGLDIKAFLFQLITFVLLLLILRKWAFPVLVKTLEDRRKAVEQSIDQAKHTEAAMKDAEAKIADMLREARDESAALVAAGHKEAATMVEEAEAKAAKRAEHIVNEAKAGMEHELDKARAALKQETAALVAEATSAIIKEKVDAKKDAALISGALKEISKGSK